jgi:hypothetical protein
MGIVSSKPPLQSLFCAKQVIPFFRFYIIKTTAHILWLVSGKTAIVHRKYLRTLLIKFFCKPSEVEDRKELVAASGLGDSTMTHVILARRRVTFIDDMGLNKGLIGEPLIFQDKVDEEAKRTSIVGEGATHRERKLYWILGKFFSNTLRASRSISHKRVDAENIGILPNSIDLDTVLMQEDLSKYPFVHLNMPGMYILYRFCSSQSMGIVGAGVKNLKALHVMLQRRFPALPAAEPPLETLPYITRQTVAYALSLVMLCVCYAFNDPMTKGRADQLYENVMAGYGKLDDDQFQEILSFTLTEWVTKVTAPESAESGVGVMSQQEVAEANLKKDARGTARAAAKGGSGDIEDGGGDGGDDARDAGEGAGDACNARDSGEDVEDENESGAANEEVDAGEAFGADSATTPGASPGGKQRPAPRKTAAAKKAAAAAAKKAAAAAKKAAEHDSAAAPATAALIGGGAGAAARRFLGLIRVWPGSTDSESRMPYGTAVLCSEK